MWQTVAGASPQTTGHDPEKRLTADFLTEARDWSRDPATVSHLLHDAARRRPGKTGLVFPRLDTSYTFADLESATRAAASLLTSHGVGAGDSVAVMTSNRPAFPLTWLACAQLGAILIPLNPAYKQRDARHVLAHSHATVAVADRASTSVLNEARGTDLPLRVILAASDSEHASASRDNAAPAGEHAAASGRPPTAVRPESTLNIQYTSGTTGLPKDASFPTAAITAHTQACTQFLPAY